MKWNLEKTFLSGWPKRRLSHRQTKHEEKQIFLFLSDGYAKHCIQLHCEKHIKKFNHFSIGILLFDLYYIKYIPEPKVFFRLLAWMIVSHLFLVFNHLNMCIIFCSFIHFLSYHSMSVFTSSYFFSSSSTSINIKYCVDDLTNSTFEWKKDKNSQHLIAYRI